MSTFSKKEVRKKRRNALIKERLKPENDAQDNEGSIFAITHGLFLVFTALILWFITQDIFVTITAFIASLIASNFPLNNPDRILFNTKVIWVTAFALSFLTFVHSYFHHFIGAASTVLILLTFALSLAQHPATVKKTTLDV
jgi:phosphatidylserine synthase